MSQNPSRAQQHGIERMASDKGKTFEESVLIKGRKERKEPIPGIKVKVEEAKNESIARVQVKVEEAKNESIARVQVKVEEAKNEPIARVQVKVEEAKNEEVPMRMRSAKGQQWGVQALRTQGNGCIEKRVNLGRVDDLNSSVRPIKKEDDVLQNKGVRKRARAEPGEDREVEVTTGLPKTISVSATQHVEAILADNWSFNSPYRTRCDAVTGVLAGNDEDPYVMRVDNCVSLGQRCLWMSDGRILYGPTESGKSVIHRESSSIYTVDVNRGGYYLFGVDGRIRGVLDQVPVRMRWLTKDKKLLDLLEEGYKLMCQVYHIEDGGGWIKWWSTANTPALDDDLGSNEDEMKVTN